MQEFLPGEPSVREDGDDLPDEVTPYTYQITSYGADYTVDSLVQRLDREDIIIPEFQRRFVWDRKRASRFVESLLLGLPVPGIFLYREPDTNRLVVIDGQQRLKSLAYFYINRWENGSEFRLTGVQEQFDGLAYEELDDASRRRLDDSIVHATIVNQDKPSDDNSSIYFIFERLNTGGVVLSSQEIRACIYHGAFNRFLYQINQHGAWRELYGVESSRRKDEELILRFLALRFPDQEYTKPMHLYLNRYMAVHRTLNDEQLHKFEKSFRDATSIIAARVGRSAFRPAGRLNSAVAESIMVGVSVALDHAPDRYFDDLPDKIAQLWQLEEYRAVCLSSTTDEESVSTRLKLATETIGAQ